MTLQLESLTLLFHFVPICTRVSYPHPPHFWSICHVGLKVSMQRIHLCIRIFSYIVFVHISNPFSLSLFLSLEEIDRTMLYHLISEILWFKRISFLAKWIRRKWYHGKTIWYSTKIVGQNRCLLVSSADLLIFPGALVLIHYLIKVILKFILAGSGPPPSPTSRS